MSSNNGREIGNLHWGACDNCVHGEDIKGEVTHDVACKIEKGEWLLNLKIHLGKLSCGCFAPIPPKETPKLNTPKTMVFGGQRNNYV